VTIRFGGDQRSTMENLCAASTSYGAHRGVSSRAKVLLSVSERGRGACVPPVRRRGTPRRSVSRERPKTKNGLVAAPGEAGESQGKALLPSKVGTGKRWW
jgi:hypothetical protein